MPCNTNWLCVPFGVTRAERNSRWVAVNLAAFGSAFGSFVAAVRGIRNLNSLPGDAMCYSGWSFLPLE
jgi:hypothetical protein